MRFDCASAMGGPAARRLAQSATNASTSASATTRLTRPMRSASCAPMISASSANSFARCMPTRRGSTQLPPKSKDRPRLANISEKRAVSEATTKSQMRAMLQPAPTATPRTLAMVGCGMRASAMHTSVMLRMDDNGCNLSGWAEPPLRSAPLQNSPPAPVSTMTRSSGFDPISKNVCFSSAHMVPLAAFFLEGRFMVTVTMPSWRKTSSVSITQTILSRWDSIRIASMYAAQATTSLLPRQWWPLLPCLHGLWPANNRGYLGRPVWRSGSAPSAAVRSVEGVRVPWLQP